MKVFKFAAVAAACAMAAAATAATALPPGVSERTTYYSDSSLTQVVGQYQINCDGSDAFWGVVSGHPIIENGDC